MGKIEKIENIEKCWKIIGVYGDGACEKIDKYNHCRHCPEYSKAGRSLLDRDISELAIEEWSQVYSIPKKHEDSDSVSVVIFRVLNEWFALKTKFFQETIEMKPIHIVPFRTNKVFSGLVNVGGELLLAMATKNLFELNELTEEKIVSNAFKRMIVIVRNNQRCVLPVDEVIGVTKISDSIIQRTPVTLSKSPNSLSSGIFILNNKNIGLVDEEKLFTSIEKILSW